MQNQAKKTEKRTIVNERPIPVPSWLLEIDCQCTIINKCCLDNPEMIELTSTR
jgi:hypothetical protein